MKMQTVNFEVVQMSVQKKFPCTHCGKKRQRTRTFSQTLNPWNKTDAGHVKDRVQIMHENRENAKEWLTAPGMCVGCEKEENLLKYEADDDEDDEDEK